MKSFFDSDTERRGARARLRDVIREHSLAFGSFTLASGGRSHYYLDLRKTVTHPEGAHLVSTLLLDRIQTWRPDAAGGPTLGADPIAGALAALSHLHGAPLRTFIVRSHAKGHGTGRQVEGNLQSGDRVVLLDDVITRGGSLIRAARIVAGLGAEIVRVLTILDRQEGGGAAIEREGLQLESLFTLPDILSAQELEGPPQGESESGPAPRSRRAGDAP
ncbi:MAG: orotate phosphoribosyltransferase [Candidatus Eisenbacteria bacterium]|nr:orotate phosphoribosyltransferase [Candidatus Eisenbacteria bacterium]